MNKVAPPFNLVRQEVSLTRSELIARQIAGATPVIPEDLIHELRQPLSVIDSLVYYIELTSEDENIGTHLEQIRAMVSQANRILERASNTLSELPMGAQYLSTA